MREYTMYTYETSFGILTCVWVYLNIVGMVMISR